MAYSIKAVATEYKGIVFRSKLEAMCYDYLLNKYPQFEIIYEPDVYRLTTWNPDFGLYEFGELAHLVEVKPETRKFDVIKYVIESTQLETPPTILCMYDMYIIEFLIDGGFFIHPIKEILWKQAFNNVNYGGK